MIDILRNIFIFWVRNLIFYLGYQQHPNGILSLFLVIKPKITVHNDFLSHEKNPQKEAYYVEWKTIYRPEKGYRIFEQCY